EIRRADVAVVGAGRSGRLHRVVRTRRARDGAELCVVALIGRRATRGARVARIVDAQRIPRRPVTQVRRADVAVVRARRPRRLHGVARTGGAVARTRLLEVALVGRRATDECRELERVVGARAAAARARLSHVAATARGGAARGPGIARVVDAERTPDGAVAEVRRADVGVVGARGARRLHGVVRTGRARAGTELGVVAFVGRCAARRAGVARGMHACRGAGGAVAEVRRA